MGHILLEVCLQALIVSQLKRQHPSDPSYILLPKNIDGPMTTHVTCQVFSRPSYSLGCIPLSWWWLRGTKTIWERRTETWRPCAIWDSAISTLCAPNLPPTHRKLHESSRVQDTCLFEHGGPKCDHLSQRSLPAFFLKRSALGFHTLNNCYGSMATYPTGLATVWCEPCR